MSNVHGCLRRGFRVGLALFVGLLALALVTHPGRVALKSAGLFIEIFPAAPAYPLRWLTPKPSIEMVHYPLGNAEAVAYLYRPAGDGPYGALVFYIGVGPEHDNTHLVRVSEGLARAGVVVMIPVSEALSDFRLVPGEEEGAVAAFEYLRAQPYVDPERVGFLGVSAGGSVVALAAEDPRIADDVRLLTTFGSYYSAFDLLAALVLRKIEVDGQWRAWEPSVVPLEILRDGLLASVSESDRRLLEPLLKHATTEIPEGLTPEGRAVADVLVNRDPARMPDLLAALPKATHEYLVALSPSTRVESLHAEILLMHDVQDTIIPFTESVRFYREAEEVRSKRLTLLKLFRHVEPKGDNPAGLVVEGTKLYVFVYHLLLGLT